MTFTEEQQIEHEQVMKALCQGFHKKTLPMVLKGGTALKLCYGLDRFSEELHFDSIKPLNLEHAIADIFTQLGKSQAKFRHPKITLTKKTDTVRRYRVTYGDSINLKIETSLRSTPDDEDIIELKGILTYKVSVLIKQKLGALLGRTTARDLHDVVFLYEHFYEDFGDTQKATIIDLYTAQDSVLERFSPAYSEDSILTTTDLLADLMKLIELVESH